MECTSLEATDHLVLAALSVLPGRYKEVPQGFWDAFGVTLAQATDSLYELQTEGAWIDRRASGIFRVNESCNCSYKTSAKRSFRRWKKGLGQPRMTVGVDVGEEYSAVVVAETDGERTHVRSLITQPLRSRGGDEEPEASTSGYRDLAGKRVSGRRIATDVAARRRRRNTTLAWEDLPPEKWNATHLAGYFDAQTFTHLQGRSADRYVLKPMLAHFAKLRREGITSVECKQMVDLFVQQEASQDGRIDSLWKRFIAQRGRLARLLTTNAGRRYNNQPHGGGTHDDDDEERWL